MDTSKNIGKMTTRSESSVDKGWDACKLNTNTKNTTTMKIENKCFFSISLENGITITGDSPYEVKNFLNDLHLCIDDAIKSGLNDELPDWKNYLIDLRKQMIDAWTIIYNNQKK